jgi:hypothetical protein
VWGRGEYGRLGLGDDCADKQRPVELTLGSWGGDPRPPRIIDAALGGTHSCLLDESGVVYSFGRNSLGRLGRVRFYLFLFPYLFYLHMGNCTDVVFCFAVFLYSAFYFATKLDITRTVPTIMYFCYMGLLSLGFLMITGTVGFVSCLGFVRAIYGSVKID